MWGAEMGSNAAGVCIASESVYSNFNSDKDIDYLTAMDLLRLALMFGDSALDAVKIIDHYLHHYQQGGCQQWMNIGQSSYYATYLIAGIYIIYTTHLYIDIYIYIYHISSIIYIYTDYNSQYHY